MELANYQKESERIENHPNPLTKYGKKCFSQGCEDGITMEIAKRLSINNGTCIEFGAGDGMTNNTLILIASGWKAYWFGGVDLVYSLEKSTRVDFEKTWITNENIVNLYKNAENKLGENIDFVSLDLDGNDFLFHRGAIEKQV